MSAVDDRVIAGLFRHSLRPDWGLAVLSHEGDGKRHYLFEDGRRRALAQDFDLLMLRVEEPTPEQHAAYASLRKLALRAVAPQDAAISESEEFEAQVARLHARFPAGLSDPAWVSDFRSGANGGGTGRDAAVEGARAKLGVTALEGLLSARRFDEAWSLAQSVLSESGLLPAEGSKRATPGGQALHELVVALRALLHDEGPYPVRFDRYVRALTAAHGRAPSWELATLPSALLYPREHIYVELASFRRLIKASKLRRTIPAQPTGATYTMLLSLARSLVRKLTERGEAPRDLLDVRDFMSVALVAARVPKPPVARSPGKRVRPSS